MGFSMHPSLFGRDKKEKEIKQEIGAVLSYLIKYGLFEKSVTYSASEFTKKNPIKRLLLTVRLMIFLLRIGLVI